MQYSNKMLLRLYGLDNCPHCQNAINYLIGRGIPFQYIQAINDPVINQGVVFVTGKPSFPVLVVFGEGRNEILSGFTLEHYERITDEYIKSCSSTGTNDAVVNEGNNSGQAAQVPTEQK